jgi:hypothetical protein
MPEPVTRNLAGLTILCPPDKLTFMTFSDNHYHTCQNSLNNHLAFTSSIPEYIQTYWSAISIGILDLTISPD